MDVPVGQQVQSARFLNRNAIADWYVQQAGGGAVHETYQVITEGPIIFYGVQPTPRVARVEEAVDPGKVLTTGLCL